MIYFRNKINYSLQSVQTGSKTHRFSYSSIGDLSSDVKRLECEADRLTESVAGVKNVLNRTSTTPLFFFSSNDTY